jgi:hypothetical protein
MHGRARLLAAGVALAALLIGCGASHSAPISPAARIEHRGSAERIVLSAAGAQRIGLQTAQTRGVPPPPPIVATRLNALGIPHKVVIKRPLTGPTVVIPFSAVVYDSSGRTYAFVAVAHLTFAEVRIAVDHIDGSSAYLLKGPPAGSKVVSTGAEELYGVQTGVLAQT